MRVRVDHLALEGTERVADLKPGLNVITGPITTGKTTLLRLIRVLLGGNVRDFPPEVRECVQGVRGRIVLDDEDFDIYRPLVSTTTAKVEIAGSSTAERLPALQRDETAQQTYGEWLQAKLGLPQVRVPVSANPETPMSRVTINDYMLYCYLAQDEIDSSVYGHRDNFRNNKRKAVFQIMYGLHSPEMALLEEELRRVQLEERALEEQQVLFERFVAETPWENRAALERQLEEAESSLREISDGERQVVVESNAVPQVEALRATAQALEGQRAEFISQRRRELDAAEDLRALIAQLTTQSERLTRSIVADEYLVDFEFVVCPRCGTQLPERGDEQECRLCLQQPAEPVDRSTLAAEQDRLGVQIREARSLIETHEESEARLGSELGELDQRLRAARAALDQATNAYVSQRAETIAQHAHDRARQEAEVLRLRDYLTLYDKTRSVQRDLARVQLERQQLEDRLDAAQAAQTGGEERVRHLEAEFETILRAFGAPRFADEPRASINRETYMPVLDGRRFDDLSSQGLQVLVNVAHTLAHHLTALHFGLPLPSTVLIDGLTSNVGHEGFDQERVDAVYAYLAHLSDERGADLQIIVADNDVPADARRFIALELGADDRLVVPYPCTASSTAPEPTVSDGG